MEFSIHVTRNIRSAHFLWSNLREHGEIWIPEDEPSERELSNEQIGLVTIFHHRYFERLIMKNRRHRFLIDRLYREDDFNREKNDRLP